VCRCCSPSLSRRCPTEPHTSRVSPRARTSFVSTRCRSLAPTRARDLHRSTTLPTHKRSYELRTCFACQPKRPPRAPPLPPPPPRASASTTHCPRPPPPLVASLLRVSASCVRVLLRCSSRPRLGSLIVWRRCCETARNCSSTAVLAAAPPALSWSQATRRSRPRSTVPPPAGCPLL